VSILLDNGARELLARAYAARRGEWVMTRLADPPPGARAYAAELGIDLDGPDNAPTQSGRRDDARSRWGRAFTRALWHQHLWYGPAPGRAARGQLRGVRRMVRNPAPLQVEWGRRLPARGVIPAGRAVRVRVPAGGRTSMRVVESKRDIDRIYESDGAPGGRHALLEGRDWQ